MINLKDQKAVLGYLAAQIKTQVWYLEGVEFSAHIRFRAGPGVTPTRSVWAQMELGTECPPVLITLDIHFIADTTYEI